MKIASSYEWFFIQTNLLLMDNFNFNVNCISLTYTCACTKLVNDVITYNKTHENALKWKMRFGRVDRAFKLRNFIS